MMAKARTRVAIVGAGAAGLGAAWSLMSKSDTLDITVFEKEREAGGNAHTGAFPTTRGPGFADMGVSLTSPWSYPNLYELFRQLEVETYAAQISLGGSFGETQSWFTGGMQGTEFWQFVAADVETFQRRLFKALNDDLMLLEPLSKLTAGLSNEFVSMVLCPVLSLFIVTRASLLEQPIGYAGSLITSLSFVAPTTWWLVDGGTRTYVNRTVAALRSTMTVRLSCPVLSAMWTPEGVVITAHDTSSNTPISETFDHVVLATEANVSYRLLVNGTEEQKRLLGAFSYEPAIVYLHGDESVLSPYLPRDLLSQYVYFGPNPEPNLAGVFTYNVGEGFGVPRALSSVYSLATKRDPPKRIVVEKHWQHVQVTPESLMVQSQLHNIQGDRNIWYCGTYASYASHEGALTSGFAVAEALAAKLGLGSVYPYAGSLLALKSFRDTQATMFPPSGAEVAARRHALVRMYTP